jgi:ABC-type Fe2+-enterobactin transport system substrate-binding protein
MYSNAIYSGLALLNEVPVYQLANGSLVGYGSQCVRSFSIGVDGALWAISCTLDPSTNATNASNNNYQIIKWDPFLQQWYVVQGKTGVQISAFNEISAAVLTAQGLIYVSSNNRDSTPASYNNKTATYTNFFNDSIILTNENAQWLRNQLLSYGSS